MVPAAVSSAAGFAFQSAVGMVSEQVDVIHAVGTNVRRPPPMTCDAHRAAAVNRELPCAMRRAPSIPWLGTAHMDTRALVGFCPRPLHCCWFEAQLFGFLDQPLVWFVG